MYQDARQELQRLEKLLEETPEEPVETQEPAPEPDWEEEMEEAYMEPETGSSHRGLAILAVLSVAVSVGALCVLLWWILRQRGVAG